MDLWGRTTPLLPGGTRNSANSGENLDGRRFRSKFEKLQPRPSKLQSRSMAGVGGPDGQTARAWPWPTMGHLKYAGRLLPGKLSRMVGGGAFCEAGEDQQLSASFRAMPEKSKGSCSIIFSGRHLAMRTSCQPGRRFGRAKGFELKGFPSFIRMEGTKVEVSASKILRGKAACNSHPDGIEKDGAQEKSFALARGVAMSILVQATKTRLLVQGFHRPRTGKLPRPANELSTATTLLAGVTPGKRWHQRSRASRISKTHRCRTGRLKKKPRGGKRLRDFRSPPTPPMPILEGRPERRDPAEIGCITRRHAPPSKCARRLLFVGIQEKRAFHRPELARTSFLPQMQRSA